MSKLETPDWIIEGYDSKEEYGKARGTKSKKKGKTFKLRKCPECGSKNIGVVLGQEEGKGGWYCKSCKWEGESVDEKELSEKEFVEHLNSEGK